MFEVPIGHTWPGYLKFTTKGKDNHDNQKWFLVKSGNNIYKLKNKATNKTVDVQAYFGSLYLKTT
jgi:Ricin-type beta-trefoil lectin domain-like